MKRKHARRTHHRRTLTARSKPTENYLIVVRSWMLVVIFAIMLGVGAIVGTFLNTQLEQTSPAVAGAQTQVK